jgi:hypothetical protein
MKKTKNQFFDTELEVVVLAIICVAGLETLALMKGVDGVMFGAAMTAIGVIIGWIYKGYRNKNKS